MTELIALDHLNGILSCIVVGISFYVGIYILLKYVQLKNKNHLYVALVAFITSEPWWPHVISYILALAGGEGLEPIPYFMLGSIFIPLAIALWLLALSNLQYQEKKRVLLIFSIVYLIAYEVIFLSALFTNMSIVGMRIGVIDVQYNFIMLGLLMSALLIILPTGLNFARVSLNSLNTEIKMKGKFLAMAFITFCVGASVDALILSNPFNLVIARLLLVLASMGFLGGFVPPDWMKKIFLNY